jgi:uncharacterized membrane protein YbhN (UPF0104 family)
MKKEISPSSGKRQTTLRWVGTLLSIALLIYLLSQQGWEAIGTVTRQIDWWRFIVAFGLMMVSRLAVCGRWYELLRTAGIAITPRQTIRITFAGLFASNFLPTTIGGDVVRLAGIIRLGFDQAISLASLVVDRLVGLAGMAMALPFIIPGLIEYYSGSRSVFNLSIPFVAGLATSRQSWWRKLWDKVVQFTQRIIQSLSIWLEKPLSLLRALGFTWVHMLSLYLQVWILLRGMGEDVPLWLIAGLWSATYFVTLLPISINGMGVQELSMAFFFSSVAGISASNALTLALLMRAIQILASLPGAISLPDIIAGEKKSGS